MSYIELNGVIKVYKSRALEVVALRGLNMKVEKGEIIAIMGPSGSGKTTLLNIMGALDTPTAGSVKVDGGSIIGLKEKELVKYRRHTVGFVFQFFNLVPTLSARENIELPLRFAGMSHAERRERVDHLIDLIGMKDRERSRPDELSGGEQQRIAIAVALANDPELILADEPTGELDTETGKAVLNIFQRLKEKQGKTIIIVTHDERISRIADRIAHIVDGMIVDDGAGLGMGDGGSKTRGNNTGAKIKGAGRKGVSGEKDGIAGKGGLKKKNAKTGRSRRRHGKGPGESSSDQEEQISQDRGKSGGSLPVDNAMPDRDPKNIINEDRALYIPIEGTKKLLRIEISEVDGTEKRKAMPGGRGAKDGGN